MPFSSPSPLSLFPHPLLHHLLPLIPFSTMPFSSSPSSHPLLNYPLLLIPFPTIPFSSSPSPPSHGKGPGSFLLGWFLNNTAMRMTLGSFSSCKSILLWEYIESVLGEENQTPHQTNPTITSLQKIQQQQGTNQPTHLQNTTKYNNKPHQSTSRKQPTR